MSNCIFVWRTRQNKGFCHKRLWAEVNTLRKIGITWIISALLCICYFFYENKLKWSKVFKMTLWLTDGKSKMKTSSEWVIYYCLHGWQKAQTQVLSNCGVVTLIDELLYAPKILCAHIIVSFSYSWNLSISKSSLNWNQCEKWLISLFHNHIGVIYIDKWVMSLISMSAIIMVSHLTN